MSDILKQIESATAAEEWHPEPALGLVILLREAAAEIERLRSLQYVSPIIIPDDGSVTLEDAATALRSLVSCVERDRTGAGILLPTEAALATARDLLSRISPESK